MRAELESRGVKGLHVLRRGVDTEPFHPRFASEQMRERLSQGHPDKKLLVFVGRLAAEKEIHRLRPMMGRRDDVALAIVGDGDRKSTRLNSSHVAISYAVFCLKKKTV